MNKIKGSLNAVKMKYLMFVFAVAMLAALPTRVYQLFAIVDYTNGFYNGNDITVPVLYGALFIFALIFMVLSFLSKEVPSPKLPVGKNPILGVASIFMIVGLGWDILSIERKVVPQVQGGFSFDMFKSILASNLEQSGGIFLVLQFVFAILAVFYFIIFAVSHLNGKASYKEYKLLALSPLCWAITMLVSRLMTAVSFISVSELLFEIFMLVFAMLFFLTFARISSGVFTEDSMWGIYGYGFAAALFAGLVTIPRIVCAIVGLPAVEGYEFSLAHLSILLFILSYIVASLGIGFKDGIKNIRTLAEVDLPDDENVVIKQSKASADDGAAQPEYELFEAPEDTEDVSGTVEETEQLEEEISEENEIEESEEDLLVEEDDVSAFLQEPEEIVVETEEIPEESDSIDELLDVLENFKDDTQEMVEEVEEEIVELPLFEEEVEYGNSEETEEVVQEDIQKAQEIDEGSEEVEEAGESQEVEEIEELPFFEEAFSEEDFAEAEESFEEEIEEDFEEEEIEEVEDIPEVIAEDADDAENAYEDEEAFFEDELEKVFEITEEAEETDSADEYEEDEAEEQVTDNVAEESVENEYSEDEASEDDAEYELVVEEKPKKEKKEKKDKKSLFGLRKAPVQVVEEAEDLKPISLADLKKKQNLE